MPLVHLAIRFQESALATTAAVHLLAAEVVPECRARERAELLLAAEAVPGESRVAMVVPQEAPPTQCHLDQSIVVAEEATAAAAEATPQESP